jgi:uncharacterized protein (DUF1800 family)
MSSRFRSGYQYVWILSLLFFINNSCIAQYVPVILGQGNHEGIVIESSDETVEGQAINTLTETGYLPNMTAASRFLAQAGLGHNFEDIEGLAAQGIEDWIDAQMGMPVSFNLLDKVLEYQDIRRDSLNDPDAGQSGYFFDLAWWQYHMISDDVLRQRVAFALSELLVVSRFSSFGNRSYAFADYYDIFLNNAFGNYRDILQEVTYHPAMGIYLTYLNNPKTDTVQGTFPDENYAREVMQLFTIGLHELNMDGSYQTDSNGDPIPTYGNTEIAEFSKIFTGLSWQDRDQFFKGPYADSSYTLDMKMFNEYHEPGVKNLLNNFQVPDRDPVDGNADITDALDNLFDHQNTAPFISKHLIMRLVTSNPSPAYIQRVATVFNNNGQGVKGDLAAVVRAILLDPEARDCDMANDISYGMLREPFIRYLQINKAFDATTMSGEFRNDMYWVYEYVEQKPMMSPSVFNFFQPDYAPIGTIDSLGFVAPEFQLTNAQTVTGFINGLYRWVIQDNPQDEQRIFSNENLDDKIASLDVSDEILLAEDSHLPILLDRLNLILAQGKLSPQTEQTIIDAIEVFESSDPEDLDLRARLAIYLSMCSPQYLINR